jgi:hypothetical protein
MRSPPLDRPWRSAMVAKIVFFAMALASNGLAQTQLWIRQFGSTLIDSARTAAPDSAGGVIFGGLTGGLLGSMSAGAHDAWVARHDALGNQVWLRQFGTSANDEVSAVAPAGSSGTYVAGITGGGLAGPSAGSSDLFVALLDAAGSLLWMRQFGSSAGDVVLHALADGPNGLFLCGNTAGDLGSPNAGGIDAWVGRFDVAGNPIWIRQYGTGFDEEYYAAVPDGAGGVIVVGSSVGSLWGPAAGDADVVLARLDAAGSLIWSRQFGSTAYDDANKAAADGMGGVYLGGFTRSALAAPPSAWGDAWLARYDAQGGRVWIRQFASTPFGATEIFGISLDDSGGVLIGGRTQGDFAAPSAGGTDVWMAGFDRAGSETWRHQFGTNRLDHLLAIATDGSGGVFVAGETSGALGGPHVGNLDVWLARYAGLSVERYCAPAVPNATGQAGMMGVIGSSVIALNDLELVATGLPLHTFGYFLTSASQASVPQPGGSQGVLCLGGGLGAYSGPGQVKNTGGSGRIELVADLTQHPTSAGPVVVLTGQSWNFQAWYRDNVGGLATSNFTDAMRVRFH